MKPERSTGWFVVWLVSWSQLVSMGPLRSPYNMHADINIHHHNQLPTRWLEPGDRVYGAQYDEAGPAGVLAVPGDDEDVRIRLVQRGVKADSEDQRGQNEAEQGDRPTHLVQ